MITSTLAAITDKIALGGIEFNQDLPRPNLYWCTVKHAEFGEFNSYFAGEFTQAAQAKVQRWCRETHGFAPYRSVSTILMRRLKLGDLVQNPLAFDVARRHAVEAGESDIVAALDKLPTWIAQQAGLLPLPVAPTASLWERLTAEVERYSATGR